MDVGLEGVVVDCQVRGLRREVRLLDVVDAMLARFELEFEVDDWESYGCQRDEEDAADLALRDRRRRGGTLGDAGAGREEEREEREEVERVQVGAHGRGVGNRLDGGSDAKLRVGVGFVDGGAWVLGPFVAAAFVFAVVLDVVVVVGVVLLLILYVGGRCKKTTACHACTQKLSFWQLLY